MTILRSDDVAPSGAEVIDALLPRKATKHKFY